MKKFIVLALVAGLGLAAFGCGKQEEKKAPEAPKEMPKEAPKEAPTEAPKEAPAPTT